MISYIDNGSNKTVLFLHGLACNSSYYNNIVGLLDSKYNFLLVDLLGHYSSSKDDFTVEEEIEFITNYCENNNIQINLVVAHSMASILAFYLDKVISNIEVLILLEGNIVVEDFEWSSKISNMKEEEFLIYWQKFQKQYPLILKMKLKHKINLEKYTQHIVDLNGLGIYKYAKIINTYKEKMILFKDSFSKIMYVESSDSGLILSKKALSKEYNFGLFLLDDSSHYMMLDNPQKIANIINKA